MIACVLPMLMWPNSGNVENQSEWAPTGRDGEEQSELLEQLEDLELFTLKRCTLEVQRRTNGS